MKTGFVDVKEDELFTYLRGEYVQTAFKSLTIPLREQIISGMHPECWEATYGREKVNYNIQGDSAYDNDGNPIYED
jgi:hypothetical protein